MLVRWRAAGLAVARVSVARVEGRTAAEVAREAVMVPVKVRKAVMRCMEVCERQMVKLVGKCW